MGVVRTISIQDGKTVLGEMISQRKAEAEEIVNQELAFGCRLFTGKKEEKL